MSDDVIVREAEPSGQHQSGVRSNTDERSGLPEANVSAVCDIVGGLFKSEILDSPKDVEITDWRSGVTFVSETINGNFLRGLEGNGIRNEPPCLLKAVRNLIFAPNKDEIEWVSLCPGFCMSYLWIGREIIGIWVKTEKGNECCYKHQQHTEHAHRMDCPFLRCPLAEKRGIGERWGRSNAP